MGSRSRGRSYSVASRGTRMSGGTINSDDAMCFDGGSYNFATQRAVEDQTFDAEEVF